jgi:hypothetical protein
LKEVLSDGDAFHSNHGQGGCVYAVSCVTVARHSAFFNNTAANNGPVLYLTGGNFTAENVSMVHNRGVLQGAIVAQDTSIMVENSLFADNIASIGYGGVLYQTALSDDTPALVHFASCAFVGNGGQINVSKLNPSYGGAVYLAGLKDRKVGILLLFLLLAFFLRYFLFKLCHCL